MFVLVGGQGTRLRKRVSSVPKAMAPVGGQPFLELFFRFWIKRGISEFVLGTGLMAEQIEGYFGSMFGSARLRYSKEPRPLGTGGSLALAVQRDKLDREFFVSNGDTIVEVCLQRMNQVAGFCETDAVVAVREKISNGARYGSFSACRGAITAVGASATQLEVWPKPRTVFNTGLLKLNPSAVETIRGNLDWLNHGASLELDILRSLVEGPHRVRALRTSGYFRDIGIPEDYDLFCAEASDFLPKLLNSSV